MKTLAALVFASVMATAASASAQKGDKSSAATDSQSMADQDCARAHKLHRECVLTFGTEDVDGKVISPDGTEISTPGMATFSSLIRLRTDFRAEIIAAAEDL